MSCVLTATEHVSAVAGYGCFEPRLLARQRPVAAEDSSVRGSVTQSQTGRYRLFSKHLMFVPQGWSEPGAPPTRAGLSIVARSLNVRPSSMPLIMSIDATARPPSEPMSAQTRWSPRDDRLALLAGLTAVTDIVLSCRPSNSRPPHNSARDPWCSSLAVTVSIKRLHVGSPFRAALRAAPAMYAKSRCFSAERNPQLTLKRIRNCPSGLATIGSIDECDADDDRAEHR